MSKKFISIVIIMTLAILSGLASVSALATPYGDCNFDGKISYNDALIALEMAVGMLETELIADMNADGMVTSYDAAEIMRLAIGESLARGVDAIPPYVSIVHSPPNPTSLDIITFTATATDANSIQWIRIWVNENIALDCNASPCTLRQGPYPEGTRIQYYATAMDGSGNVKQIETESFQINTPKTQDSPDLIIESLTHLPSSPKIDDTITFAAVVKNVGIAPAEASTLSFMVGYETVPDKYFVPSLKPGATYTVVRTEKMNLGGPYQNVVIADIDNVVSEADERNNKLIDYYFIEGRFDYFLETWDEEGFQIVVVPDLVIENLTHSPNNPTISDTITFTATVKNEGTGPAKASTLSFHVDDERIPLRFSVPSLEPGESYSVERTEILTVAQTYENVVIADVDNVISEIYEVNNKRMEVYTVTQFPLTVVTPTISIGFTGKPDLVIESLQPCPSEPLTLTVEAVVKNMGIVSADASVLGFQIDKYTSQTFAVPSLKPGATFAVECTSSFKVGGVYKIIAIADVTNLVIESNEANNYMTQGFTVVGATPVTFEIVPVK